LLSKVINDSMKKSKKTAKAVFLLSKPNQNPGLERNQGISINNQLTQAGMIFKI